MFSVWICPLFLWFCRWTLWSLSFITFYLRPWAWNDFGWAHVHFLGRKTDPSTLRRHRPSSTAYCWRRFQFLMTHLLGRRSPWVHSIGSQPICSGPCYIWTWCIDRPAGCLLPQMALTIGSPYREQVEPPNWNLVYVVLDQQYWYPRKMEGPHSDSIFIS